MNITEVEDACLYLSTLIAKFGIPMVRVIWVTTTLNKRTKSEIEHSICWNTLFYSQNTLLMRGKDIPNRFFIILQINNSYYFWPCQIGQQTPNSPAMLRKRMPLHLSTLYSGRKFWPKIHLNVRKPFVWVCKYILTRRFWNKKYLKIFDPVWANCHCSHMVMIKCPAP